MKHNKSQLKDLTEEQLEEFNQHNHDNSFKVHNKGVKTHNAKYKKSTDRKNAIRYPLSFSSK